VEALKIVKKSGKDIPVIVVSGSLGDEAAVEYIRQGATDYVLKDRMARLPSAVGRALEAKATRAERKRAEAERVRLMTAIEQSADSVLMTDINGCIEYANYAFEKITGYSRQEVLGENPRLLKSGKHDKAFYENLWNTILEGKTWHGEIINRRKDGSLTADEMRIAPVRGERGEVTGFIAINRDVTERKQLEEQLRQAQKMEAVGRLAGGVAHDFNNLLTVIKGYTQLLSNHLAADNPLHGHVDEIQKAGDRAAGLTRQLLAFSRQQVLAPQVLDLSAVIANMEKMLRRLIGEDIELATIKGEGLGRVKADPGQIEQVIMNLAVNARDAMPKGGKLTIETANVEMDPAYTRNHVAGIPGVYVMLAVSDTGIGMDARTLAHIFEPFFTTKERGKGTGLGLSTVYGIVKQSGGNIWAYSEPGHGATFKIYLPRLLEGAEAAEQPKAQTRLQGGSETVLLV
jgi:PAS domain S-box-containing protein